MKPDRYRHILRLLHFTDSNNEPDMTEENSDMLRKMRNLFEILNRKFSKFYNPSEHLAVEEVIVLFKEVSFSDNTHPRNTKVLVTKFTKYVMSLFTRII
jgi:hypothetical protein